MKTLLRTHPARLRRARPPRSHDKLSLHPSNNAPARVAPDGVFKSSPNAGGGGERIRTDDLLLAKQALSQLSYTPFSGPRCQEPGNILTPDSSFLNWWAREDLNLRPHAYQARALTS
jgi:hypothetical protein